MGEYRVIKIPDGLAKLIDRLIEDTGQYATRTEFVKELIRRELRVRGLLVTD